MAVPPIPPNGKYTLTGSGGCNYVTTVVGGGGGGGPQFIPHPFEQVSTEWEQWFAWYPVKVAGRYTWLTTVCRRWTFRFGVPDRNGHYEYGTIFDVLSQ